MKIQLSLISGVDLSFDAVSCVDVFGVVVDGVLAFELTYDYGGDPALPNEGSMSCKKVGLLNAYDLPGVNNGIGLLIKTMSKLDFLLMSSQDDPEFYANLFIDEDGAKILHEVDYTEIQ